MSPSSCPGDGQGGVWLTSLVGGSGVTTRPRGGGGAGGPAATARGSQWEAGAVVPLPLRETRRPESSRERGAGLLGVEDRGWSRWPWRSSPRPARWESLRDPTPPSPTSCAWPPPSSVRPPRGGRSPPATALRCSRSRGRADPRDLRRHGSDDRDGLGGHPRRRGRSRRRRPRPRRGEPGLRRGVDDVGPPGVGSRSTDRHRPPGPRQPDAKVGSGLRLRTVPGGPAVRGGLEAGEPSPWRGSRASTRPTAPVSSR